MPTTSSAFATASRERFETRLEHSISGTPVIVFAVDADGVLLMVHGKRELKELHLSADGIIGASLFTAFASAPSICRAVKAALAGSDMTVRAELGTRRFDVTIAPTTDPDLPVRAFGVMVDVTDLLRSPIQTSKGGTMQKMRFLMERLPMGIAFFDPSGNLRYVNSHIASLFGFKGSSVDTSEEGATDDSMRFVSDLLGTVDSAHSLIQTARTSQPPLKDDQMTLANGRVYERRDVPIHDDQGVLMGHLWLVRDVTDDEHAKEQIKESHQYAQRILDGSIDIIAVLDEKGVVKTVNAAFTNTLGHPTDEVLGKDYTSYVHPEDVKGMKEHFVHIFKHPKDPTPSFRYRMHHANGEWIWMESDAKNLLDDSAVKGVIISTKDISKRIHDEMELQDRARQQTILMNFTRTAGNHGSEQPLSMEILRAASIGLKVPTGAIFTVGDEAADITLTAHTGLDDAWLSQSERHLVFDNLTQVGITVSTEHPLMSEDLEAETRFTASALQRTNKFRSCVTVPLLAGGRIRGAIAMYSKEAHAFAAEDITFIEALANIHASAIERLGNIGRVRIMDALKGNFVQIVGHQLRTPMNAIRWNLDLLLEAEYGDMNESQLAALRTMYEANNSAIERIDQFLTAMDAQSGKLTLAKTEFSFNHLIEATIKGAERRCASKNITCVRGSRITDDTVEADMKYMRAVLEILITNALDYSHDGTITISTRKKKHVLRVEVIDEGIGISPPDAPHLFNLFYRGADAPKMKPDASGLGLFIAKAIIEKHDGTIGAKSGRSKGTTFWFEIPRRKVY